jgi:hypothetical protein
MKAVALSPSRDPNWSTDRTPGRPPTRSSSAPTTAASVAVTCTPRRTRSTGPGSCWATSRRRDPPGRPGGARLEGGPARHRQPQRERLPPVRGLPQRPGQPLHGRHPGAPRGRRPRRRHGRAGRAARLLPAAAARRPRHPPRRLDRTPGRGRSRRPHLTRQGRRPSPKRPGRADGSIARSPPCGAAAPLLERAMPSQASNRTRAPQGMAEVVPGFVELEVAVPA